MARAMYLNSYDVSRRESATTISLPLSRRPLSSSAEMRGTSLNLVGTWLTDGSGIGVGGAGVDVGMAVGATVMVAVGFSYYRARDQKDLGLRYRIPIFVVVNVVQIYIKISKKLKGSHLPREVCLIRLINEQ